MPNRRSRHAWVVAPFRRDRDAVTRDPAYLWHVVDAHRNLRGPYTAAGELVRMLAPLAHARAPDLVEAYQLTLFSVAPDLGNRLPVSSAMERLFSYSGEGYPRSWTRGLAHGLADFLIGFAALAPAKPRGIAFENVDQADPLDRECIAILLRRCDPTLVMLRIGTASDEVDHRLRHALEEHTIQARPEPVSRRRAVGWRAEWAALRELTEDLDVTAIGCADGRVSEALDAGVGRLPAAQRRRLAEAYVASGCTSDHPLEVRAYAG